MNVPTTSMRNGMGTDRLYPDLVDPLLGNRSKMPSSTEIIEEYPSYKELRALGKDGEARLIRRNYRRAVYSLVLRALREGRLVCADECERCGSTDKCEAHHENYDRPLDVRWLCRVCHSLADARRRERRPVADIHRSRYEDDLTWMTEEEVADYLNVSTRTVRNWRKRDDPIPHGRVGPKLIRYHKEDVDRWVRDNEEDV